MKRSIAAPLALLIAIAGVVISAPSSGAEVYPRLDEEAFAYWSFPTSKPNWTVDHGAVIFRYEDLSTGKVHDWAGFFKARCETKKTKRSTMKTCVGFAGERATDYFFDPTLDSAWVKGKKSRVQWSGDVVYPAFYLMEERCYSVSEEGEEEEGSGRGAGRWTPADASGNIAGRKVGPGIGIHRMGMLQVGAAVTECSFLSGSAMADIAAGRRFHYSYSNELDR